VRSVARLVVACGAVVAFGAPAGVRAQCPSDPRGGTCWIVGDVVLTSIARATADGQTARCRLRCSAPAAGVLLLRDDDTYSMPPSDGTPTALSCATDVDPPPVEEGRVVRRRGGKLVLEPFDLAPFDAFVDACAGRELRILRYRTTVRVAPDGTTLAGVTKIRSVAPGRPPIASRLVARFTGVRAPAAAARADARRRARPLPACAENPAPRCVTSY